MKIIHNTSYLILLTAWVLLAGFIYLYFIDGIGVVQQNQESPFRTDKEVYYPGETVHYWHNFCKSEQIPFTRQVQFVDGIIFSMPQTFHNGTALECYEGWISHLVVPEGLPSGIYKAVISQNYHINFLRHRIYSWETDHFQVINEK